MKFNNKGFTMVDVIIAGAILAILSIIAYPSVSDFMMLQKEGEEEAFQQRILRMMEAHALDGEVYTSPADITMFATETAVYGDVPTWQIEEDAFGNDRYYRTMTEQERYRDADIEVHYTVLYSTGVDRCWSQLGEADFTCDPADITANVDELLNDGVATVKENFNAIEAPEGDFLIKHTDFKYKHEAYKKTVNRIKKITEALGEYGRLKKFEGIANGESEGLLYYPVSEGVTAAFYSEVEAATVSETTAGDVYGAAGGGIILNEDEPDDLNDVKMERRLGMVALMRLLGLPDEYCCNAMSKFEANVDGEMYEEGLFYYANPTPETAGGCDGEITALDERKLPPRITVEDYACGN